MTSLWRHLWPNYDTLDFKILTQCVEMLGERVLQVWWWYLHWFRRYRKKTRGGLEIAPPVGRGLTRAWPGGGRLTPPPLPNIRDSWKTNSAIDVKLCRLSHTIIWHRPWIFFLKSVGNFLRYGRFCDVTTRHFWSKIDQTSRVCGRRSF